MLEASPDLIADSTSFSRADLLAGATEHARRVAQALASAGPLLLIDTDVYITQSYAHFAWGETLILPAEVYAVNRANLCLYLAADVPRGQDGTRLPGTERQQPDHSPRRVLARFNIPFIGISDS